LGDARKENDLQRTSPRVKRSFESKQIAVERDALVKCFDEVQNNRVDRGANTYRKRLLNSYYAAQQNLFQK